MTKSSIMLDLDDSRSAKIADALANKTSKKILGLLAEGEKSGSEIADALKIPLNTAGYNLKKLVDAGLVEKAKRFFWSRKGKRMELYKVSNRRIVISPKSMIKGVLPAVVVAGLGAIGIKLWTNTKIQAGAMAETFARTGEKVFEEAGTAAAGEAAGSAIPGSVQDAAQGAVSLCDNAGILSIAQNAWLWFFVGALTALFVYLIWNLWRRR